MICALYKGGITNEPKFRSYHRGRVMLGKSMVRGKRKLIMQNYEHEKLYPSCAMQKRSAAW